MSWNDTKDDLAFGAKIKKLNLAPASAADAGKALIWDGTQWVLGQAGSMNELEFLAQKSQAGKLKHAQNSIMYGDSILVIPPNGVTIVLVSATYSIATSHDSAGAESVTALVYVDTELISRIHAGMGQSSGNGGGLIFDEQIKGARLVGDGTKRVRINTSIVGEGNGSVNLKWYEE